MLNILLAGAGGYVARWDVVRRIGFTFLHWTYNNPTIILNTNLPTKKGDLTKDARGVPPLTP